MFSLVFMFFVVISKCDYFELRSFDCSNVSSHYDFGYCIGIHTNDLITERYNKNTKFQTLCEWVKTPNGSAVYNAFYETHITKYPQFMEEINGMANGTSFTFQDLFTITLADEIGYFYPSPLIVIPSCSDYILNIYNNGNNIINSYMGHNEDNGPDNRNTTFLVKGKIGNGILFYSYGYAGELLTQAVGWNDKIIFTSNYVGPSNPVLGGIGRNFIARDMINQRSLDDVLRVSATDGQCAGHNYQVGEWETGRTADSEVAYYGLHAFTFTNKSVNWLFHANQYIHLNVSQGHSTSSDARQNTAAQLGEPKDLNVILTDLGNQDNASWPIYKDGQANDYTLHTFGIDLFSKSITVYADNPRKRNNIFSCGFNGNALFCQNDQ